jgi:hypothetical protein
MSDQSDVPELILGRILDELAHCPCPLGQVALPDDIARFQGELRSGQGQDADAALLDFALAPRGRQAGSHDPIRQVQHAVYT